MSRRRFYAPPENITASLVTLSTQETHHLIHVLRMTPGNDAFVFDGCGRELRCTFRRVEGNQAQLEIVDSLFDVVESPIDLTLAQALAKGEKFDFIIQKATELGVNSIVPLITRYADVRLDDQQKLNRVERWRRISLEAAKQCGRRRLVEITEPRRLSHYIAERESTHPIPSEASRIQRALLFTERGGVPVTEALADASRQSEIFAFIGPEGGWSDDELQSLTECGCQAVTLGPRVLRTETAALVALALIQHVMGDISRRVVD